MIDNFELAKQHFVIMYKKEYDKDEVWGLKEKRKRKELHRSIKSLWNVAPISHRLDGVGSVL